MEFKEKKQHIQALPGYGTFPYVIISYISTPNDQTSDLTLNFRSRAASGAVHLIGNLVSRYIQIKDITLT